MKRQDGLFLMHEDMKWVAFSTSFSVPYSSQLRLGAIPPTGRLLGGDRRGPKPEHGRDNGQ